MKNIRAELEWLRKQDEAAELDRLRDLGESYHQMHEALAGLIDKYQLIAFRGDDEPRSMDDEDLVAAIKALEQS
jgi:hypothetical protein